MDNSKEFQSMLDEAIKSEPLAFNGFDRTKNVQDQLQEMCGLYRDKLWVDTIFQFNNFFHECNTHELPVGVYEVISNPQFISMEQLWLAFVMKEKYNKVWLDNNWVEVRGDRMTKQEKIKEGLSKLEFTDMRGRPFYLSSGAVEKLLGYLHSQGVVIRVDIKGKSLDDLDFSAVKPLIEEGNEH